jgi:hypothetical protein
MDDACIVSIFATILVIVSTFDLTIFVELGSQFLFGFHNEVIIV